MKPILAFLSIPLALALAACSSPPIRHYSLGPLTPAPVSTGAALPGASGASLVVGPVGMPASVDRLFIVRLQEGARADVSEAHRWAAPLKTEVARRVAVGLARSTSYVRAVAWPQASIAEPALTLPIDVQRFEADGFERVTLEAVWTLRKAGRDVASRRFAATENIAEPGWDGLAAAHGRLVDALAADIAAHLPPP